MLFPCSEDDLSNIFHERRSRCIGREQQMWRSDLVVDVCNVHHEMYVVSKVVLENTTEDILSDIVSVRSNQSPAYYALEMRRIPCMTHMRGIVDSRTTVVPFYMTTVLRNEFCLSQ